MVKEIRQRKTGALGAGFCVIQWGVKLGVGFFGDGDGGDFVTLFDGVDDFLTIADDFAEHGVFAVEPGAGDVCDEEL